MLFDLSLTGELLINASSITDHEFALFQRLIYEHAGIALGHEKKIMVASRLARRLHFYGFASYMQYYRFIQAPDHAQEFQVMVDMLTTNETYFFREPKHFDFLRQQILLAAKTGKSLRIWSAACSTGEEPYSIAMLLDEILGRTVPWEVIASDLNTQVLEQARSGLYSMERVSEIPQYYLSNYCLKGTGSQEGKLLIGRKLRERVQFIQHNLTDLPPKLGLFDIIFLRNVLIYFNQDTKSKVITRLLPLLRSGGYFLIGHSETLNSVTTELRLVQPAIYLKS